MVIPKEDKTRYELHTHLSRLGIEGSVIEPGMLDIDYDYPYLDLDRPVSGTTSLGSIRLHGYSADIVNIIREKIYEVGHLGFGGDYGPHEFVGSGWRLRFFITHYESEVQPPSELTEFYLTTKVKIEKRFLTTKIVDFTWEAQNMVHTTRIEDEILKRVNSDSALRSILLNELGNERSITVRSYKPKKTPEQAGKGTEASYAIIVLHGELRKRKDMFISRNCFDLYNKIAKHILQAKSAL